MIWPPKFAAVLILHVRRIYAGCRIGALSALKLYGVAFNTLLRKIFVRFTVVIVRTALGAEVHDTAGELAPFGAEVVVLHFEFGDGILGRNDDGEVDVTDVQRLAVEVLSALIAERTGHLIVAPAEGVLAYRSAARAALGDGARRQGNQVEYVAAVERDFVGGALVDNLTKSRDVVG